MLLYEGEDDLSRCLGVGSERCPFSTGMQLVPRRPLLQPTPSTRVMISESINDPVPNWKEPLDEKRLSQRNPNIVNDKEPAAEVG